MYENYYETQKNHLNIHRYSVKNLICLPKTNAVQFFFVIFYSEPKQTILQFPKKGPRFQTILRNVYLSGIPELCLSSVGVYVLASAYTSICKDLEYLLKVWYIIVVDPLRDDFLIFGTVFPGRSATLPYV